MIGFTTFLKIYKTILFKIY